MIAVTQPLKIPLNLPLEKGEVPDGEHDIEIRAVTVSRGLSKVLPSFIKRD